MKTMNRTKLHIVNQWKRLTHMLKGGQNVLQYANDRDQRGLYSRMVRKVSMGVNEVILGYAMR
jgi:hypothetical protein